MKSTCIYIHQPLIMQSLYDLTWLSHIRTFNLACTDFQHCLANLMGAIYKWGSWTIYIYSCWRANAVCLYLLPIVFTCTIGHGGQKEHISGTDHVYIASPKRVRGRAPGRWGVIREGSRMRGCVGERSTTKTDNLAVHDWIVVWKMYNVKLSFFKSHAVGAICANRLI